MLAETGLVTYGKTNLDEFGMGSHSQNSAFGPVVYNIFTEPLSAGGSSGGSAVAIGMFDNVSKFQYAGGVALGTDTGGSVRLPAAYTGVLGFKPSYGILSRRGVVPYANSLDTVGMFASSIDNITSFFKGMIETDEKDPSTVSSTSQNRACEVRKQARGFSVPPALPDRGVTSTRLATQDDIGHGLHSSIRIGVPIEYNIDELAPEVRQAWHDALSLFERHGCTIVPISLPNTKHALSAYYVIAPAEASSNLAKYDGVRYGKLKRNGDSEGGVLYSQTRDGFGDEVKRRILLGSYTLSSEAIDNYFIKAQKVRRLVQRDFDRVFTIPNPLKDPTQYHLSDMDDSILLQDKLGPPQVDFIVCPTAPTTSPTLDSVSKQTPVDTYMNDVFTIPASLAGLPAISVPMVSATLDDVHAGSGIRPIGIQIIGQYSDDDQVLAMADTLLRLKKLVYIPHDPLIPELTLKHPEVRNMFSSRQRAVGFKGSKRVGRKVLFVAPLYMNKYNSKKGGRLIRHKTASIRPDKFESMKGDRRLIRKYECGRVLIRKYSGRVLIRKVESRNGDRRLIRHKPYVADGTIPRKFESRKGDRHLIRHKTYVANRKIPEVANTLSRWEEIPSDDEPKL